MLAFGVKDAALVVDHIGEGGTVLGDVHGLGAVVAADSYQHLAQTVRVDLPVHVGPGNLRLRHLPGSLAGADGAAAVVVHTEEVDGGGHTSKIAVVDRRQEVLPFLEHVRRVLTSEK